MGRATREVATTFIAEIWGRARIELVDEVVHPEYQSDGNDAGREFVRCNVTRFHTAFPDMAILILELIDDGDHVAFLVEYSGTHLGVFGGIQPTGKRVHFREAGFLRLEEEMIIDGSFVADGLGLRIQLGVLPQGFWSNLERS